jgi:hypothetical protein
MNIQTEFNNSGLIYDRFIGYSINLPYNLEKVLIAPNDTVTAGLVNLKLKHLYDNFLYLYKSCKISSNIIPVSSTAIAGVSSSSNAATWYRGLSTSQFDPFATVTWDKLDDIHTLIATNNTEENRYSMFASTGKDIITINSDKNETSFVVVLSSESYDTEFYTAINFQEVSDLSFGPNNSLLIIDLSAHTLYQYDATGYFNSDTVLKNRLFFRKSIGGRGTIYNKLEFLNPNSVCSYQNTIYVLDAGNTCVKTYDENLNWQATYGLQRDLLSTFPVKIRADNYGDVYILNNNLTIFKYDSNLRNKTVISLTGTSVEPETFRDIVFSQSDHNIFYVVSDKNVYKKFVNLPLETVGRYLLYLYKFNTPQLIRGFASISNGGGDRNILYSTYNNTGTFASFFDNANLYDILTIPDFDVYTFDEIKLDNEEYVQSWVFNKSISKLLLNLMRLRDQIIGKFLFSRDSRGNLVFKFTRYLTVDERNSTFFQSDIEGFVGKDEVFQNAVVNRCFTDIYNIQANILNVLRDEVIYRPLSGAIITLS